MGSRQIAREVIVELSATHSGGDALSSQNKRTLFQSCTRLCSRRDEPNTPMRLQSSEERRSAAVRFQSRAQLLTNSEEDRVDIPALLMSISARHYSVSAFHPHLDVDSLVRLKAAKDLVGSVVAGAQGGFNAHASNTASAIFITTSQDPQNIESSACITLVEKAPNCKDLHVSMPSIKVGTIGGGTGLPAQYPCLGMMDVEGVTRVAPTQSN